MLTQRLDREFHEKIANDNGLVLLDPLGKGSEAVVYDAVDNVRSEIVAVKAISKVFIDRRRSNRGEYSVSAMIDLGDKYPDSFPILHRVVRASDGTLLQVVMEKLKGMTLSKFLSIHALDEEESPAIDLSVKLDIALKIALALNCLHMSGKVHRDLKPSNIFLTENGKVKIFDFMHTKCRKKDGFRQGVFAGTPSYASPESFLDVTSVDHRSDLFALGIILEELFTGERFYGSGASFFDIINAIDGEDNLFEGLPPGTPIVVCEVVKSLLYCDPGLRPRTVLEVGRNLAELLIEREPYLRLQEPYYSFLGRATGL